MTHKENPVVIVGPETDEHASGTRERIEALGAEVLLIDPLRLASDLSVTLGQSAEAIEINGRLVPPAAVYVRNLVDSPGTFGVDANQDMTSNWAGTLRVFNERSDVLASLLYRWEAAGIPMYNGLGVLPRMVKPFQL